MSWTTQPTNQAVAVEQITTFTAVYDPMPTGGGYRWEVDIGSGFSNIESYHDFYVYNR